MLDPKGALRSNTIPLSLNSNYHNYPEDSLDVNIGYGSGANSYPGTSMENLDLREAVRMRLVSFLDMYYTYSEISDRVFSPPSVGEKDYSGDAYSMPLRTPLQKSTR